MEAAHGTLTFTPPVPMEARDTEGRVLIEPDISYSAQKASSRAATER